MASTAFDIFGVVGRTGKKHVAALILPRGLLTPSTPGQAQLLNSTVTTAAAIPAGAAKVYNGMAESTTGLFNGEADVGGTTLPDSDSNDPARPYTIEVREVADATDLADYASIAAKFEESDVSRFRGIPDTLNGGYLVDGEWTARVDIRFVNGEAADPVDNVEGSGDDFNLEINEEQVILSGSDLRETIEIS